MSRLRAILSGTVRIAIGAGLLWYLATSGAIEWNAVGRLFAAWPWMLLGLGVLLLDAALIAWRLVVVLAPRGFHLRLYDAFRLTLIGTFFNSCLPGSTGGDRVKIYYAAEGNPGRRVQVATIILFDRAVGMFALLLLPLLLAPFFSEMVASSAGIRAVLWAAGAICAAMLAGLLLSWWPPFARSSLLEWMLERLPLGEHLRVIFETVHGYRSARGAVLGATAISLAAHMLAAAVAMISSLAMHPQQFAWKMSVVIPLGFTANALPFTPGGLGVGEAAFNKLFSLAGLSGGAEALLGWRLLTIAISLLGLGFYLQGRRRFVHEIETMRAAEAAETVKA